MEILDIGQKIKQLRIQKGLTLEELASRSELTKGFLSQMERDLTSPSIATLNDILEALGTTLAEFFKEEKEEQLVFHKEDFFVDEREDYTIRWIVPNTQKNEMEPIVVELEPGGSTEEVEPFEGEEFGYVLSGTITLNIGGKHHKVRTGESFCLHPNESHFIRNDGKREARFLWVSTPPNF